MWSAAGFCLRPLIFNLYTHRLSTVICQAGLSCHFFADDSQLHKSNFPSDFPVLACCLKDFIEDVAEWMGGSKLKMNDDKSELMAIGRYPNNHAENIQINSEIKLPIKPKYRINIHRRNPNHTN